MPRRLFTIALPVRNGGAYLRPCVESILAQSCGDFELAILDNASTDGTADYLAGLRDGRIRLYPAARPLSITESWARLKTIPKNEFLTTIGHDDLLDPEFLAIISRLINEHPDAGLYFTHFRLIDSEGKRLRHCRPMPGRETAAEFLAARLCLLRDSFGTGHVLRSATYDALGGIPDFPKLLYADDALFLQSIGPSYRATASEEAFSYRLHLASTSGHAASRDIFVALERYSQLLLDLQTQDPAIRAVLGRYFADHALQMGGYWLDQERVDAYRARRRLDPAVRPRTAALATMFGQSTHLPRLDGIHTRLMEKAAVSWLYRVPFQAWELRSKLRSGLREGLRGFARLVTRHRSSAP